MVMFVDNDVVLFVVVVMESDEVLCLCVFVVFEGFLVVGLIVVYEFYVWSVDGWVVDVSVISLVFVEVVLIVFSCEGDGIVEKDLLDVVEKVLNSENVCLVVDCLMVCSVEIILYCVEVIIFFYLGLEVELVMVVVKVSL